jgi:RNA-splicing ligase RtcB
MPDAHVGMGCVVGFTAHLRDRIAVPAYVGKDIGCGILVFPLGKIEGKDFREKELARMDDRIRASVPMGLKGEFTVHPAAVVTRAEVEQMCLDAKAQADAVVALWRSRAKDDEKVPDPPNFGYDWFHEKCRQVGINFDYCLRGIGSLGSGNHFIELNKSSDGVYYVSIHCGSRGFGGRVCDHHQSKIMKQQAFDWVAFNKEERRLKKLFKKDKAEYEIKLKEANDRLQEAGRDAVNYLTGIRPTTTTLT